MQAVNGIRYIRTQQNKIKGHQGGARQCSNVRKTMPKVYTWANHVTKPIGCHNKPKMDRSKTVNDA